MRKRSRRSEDDLKKLAGKVADFIKGQPNGVMAGEITKKFGKLFPSRQAFLAKYGHSVKTKGSAKRPVYHA